MDNNLELLDRLAHIFKSLAMTSAAIEDDPHLKLDFYLKELGTDIWDAMTLLMRIDPALTSEFDAIMSVESSIPIEMRCAEHAEIDTDQPPDHNWDQ